MKHIEVIEATFDEGLDQYDSLRKIEEGLKNIYGSRNETIRKFISYVERLTDRCLLSRYKVFINGEPLDISTIEHYDLAEAIKDLENGNCQVNTENSEHIFLAYRDLESRIEDELQRYLKVIKNYVDAATQDANPEFYYHSIPVEKHILFETVEDENGEHFRIRRELHPYLRFLNLSRIFMSNVDISDVDLSHTNLPCFSLNYIYERRALGTDLTGVCLANHTICNADLRDSVLVGTYAIIDTSTTELKGAVIDETVTLYAADHTLLQKGEKAGKVPTLKKL